MLTIYLKYCTYNFFGRKFFNAWALAIYKKAAARSKETKHVYKYPTKKQDEVEDNSNASLYQFMLLILGIVSFIFCVFTLIKYT